MPRHGCRAGASSGAALPGRQFVLIHRCKKVGAGPERIGFENAELELALRNSDQTNNRLTNLRALCQRCHLLHDRSHHLAQRSIYPKRFLVH